MLGVPKQSIVGDIFPFNAEASANVRASNDIRG